MLDTRWGITFVTVPRRAFLQGMGAVALSSAVPGTIPAHQLPAAADAHPSERFSFARRALRDIGNVSGPHQVIAPAIRQVKAGYQAARQARGTDQQDLLHVQAQFADLIGWLYQDSGDYRAAQCWLDRALEWSHLAGDPGSVAFILARKSQLAADMHDPANAAAMAEAAARLARPHTRAAATAAVHAAHGHALVGDRSGSERRYDQARLILDGAGSDDSPWATFCDPAYISVHRAHSLAALGSHDEAAAGFRAAIGGLRPGYHRDRGVYLAREAVATAGAGDREHAGRLGLQALAIGNETLSGRIFTELAALSRILGPQPASPAADRFCTALERSVVRPAATPRDGNHR